MVLFAENVELELASMEDDALIELAHAKQALGAERILLARYFDWCQRFVRRLAFCSGLSREDTEDACQDAVFAIMKSIKRFDPDKDCRFKTFLHRVVSNRFRDFTRRQRRIVINHRRWSSQAVLEQHERYQYADPDQNPAYRTQLRETVNKFSSFLGGLEETQCEFLKQLIAGTSLRDAGDHVGISYDKAKRLRRQLQKQLSGALR